MARTVAGLPAGSRITDYISLGVLTKTFPLDKVIAVVAATEKTNQRQRDLPAHVVVYYVIALTLYMQVSYREVLRCLLEGVKWLLGPEWEVKVAGKSGISQARTRLGWEPLKRLHDELLNWFRVRFSEDSAKWPVWARGAALPIQRVLIGARKRLDEAQRLERERRQPKEAGK